MVALSLRLLSLPAGMISALFTENDVADHQFVVGFVDTLEVDGAGSGVDFRASEFVDDFVAAPSALFTGFVPLVRPRLIQSALAWPLRALTLAAT